jgi:carboxyl-terminal processing protease
MHRRSLVAALILVAGGWWLMARLEAQVRIPESAWTVSRQLEEVEAVGRQLEEQRRWGEALLHYEEAVRQHPGHTKLSERLLRARMHFEVARRYSDSRFVTSLQRTNERAALDLYNEVLAKIQSYYVHQPNWETLVTRGHEGLAVALTEAPFLERYRIPESLVRSRDFMAVIPANRAIRSRQEARDTVRSVAYAAQQQYGVPQSAVIYEYICAAATSLDDYSAFLTGSQLDEVMSQIEGNFVGLGIELRADTESLLILNVITGGPAAEGGIVAGERIVEVDGRSMREISTDTAADLLRGPEGSYVQVLMRSPEGSHRRLRIQRRRVEVPSVEKPTILDPTHGIAYLKINSFQKTTAADLESTLWQLHRHGMRSLMIDLRGNPGGLLTASVEVADKFLTEGVIVRTMGRSAGENVEYKAHELNTWQLPILLLIDENSASASEILAGAIRDHRRGLVVGTRSFGKGSVQGIFPLDSGEGGIRLTTAKFYSPSGRAISRLGVEPDVTLQSAAKPNLDEVIEQLADANQPDVVLDGAVRLFRQQLEKQSVAASTR